MPMSKEQKKSAIHALSQFIWTFKKGDNIIYNLNILWSLYDARKKAVYPIFFNKPIIIINTSVIECILDDFVNRIKRRATDPLPNIDQKIISALKTLKLETFDHFITQIRKYNFFDRGQRFYDGLDFLKKIRNRIHIQNKKGDLEQDEHRVFTDIRVRMSERILEIIMEKMITKFPRSTTPDPSVLAQFPFPWKN